MKDWWLTCFLTQNYFSALWWKIPKQKQTQTKINKKMATYFRLFEIKLQSNLQKLFFVIYYEKVSRV